MKNGKKNFISDMNSTMLLCSLAFNKVNDFISHVINIIAIEINYSQ